jgi:CBS domain-containing protein
LRLRKQAELSARDEGANRLDPDTLNDFERRILRAAFVQGRTLQSRLALDYQV